MKSHYTPSRELFLTQPNRIQRRKRKTKKQDRDYIRGTHIWICCYPFKMNEPYAVMSGKDVTKSYLKRLGEKLCAITGETHFPQAYVNVHDQDRVIRSDLDKEQSLISMIQEAYNNGSSNIKSLIYMSRNHKLMSSEEAKDDAFKLTEQEFYKKYRYYTEEMIGNLKELHVNILLNYTSSKSKFYLKTVYEKICSHFGTNSDGKAIGVSYPFITGRILADDVRYLIHADNPEKYQYDADSIVCINCTNALDLIMKGSSNRDKTKCVLSLLNIINEARIDEETEVLIYLANIEKRILLDYAINDHSVRNCIKDAVAKNRRERQRNDSFKKHEDILNENRTSTEQIVNAITSLRKDWTIKK